MHDHSAAGSSQLYVYCRYCGARNPYGQARCRECGASIKEEKPLTPIISNSCDTAEPVLTCRYCKNEVPPFSKRCPRCGVINPLQTNSRGLKSIGCLLGFIVGAFMLFCGGVTVIAIALSMWRD